MKPIEEMSTEDLISKHVELSKILEEQLRTLESAEENNDLVEKELKSKKVDKAKLMLEIATLEEESATWATPVKKAKCNVAVTRTGIKAIERLIFKPKQ